ncbi:MAG: dehydrogenase [Microbacteriaceae bacterium]|jgi:ureidoglycolate dehydrogenase (NAD+)|nr:dehydrogenase [Microbacteriaceae bacterium]
MLIEANSLESWAASLLECWDYRREDAAYLATTLVDANLRGVDSHGVARLPAYERRIVEKLVDPRAEPKVKVNGSVANVDANGAAGQIAARAASDSVLRLSRDFGAATASVRSSTHFGAAGFYARSLAANGQIAIVVSNSEPIVVPFGGRDPLLGTNPFAFAAPTSGAPVSLDMATSTSAMGKVLIAQATGQAIPDTWGVDEDGAPTTNPNAITALLPAGGPKGYGLGFLVEVLSGVLSGAAIAHGIGSMYTDFSKPQDVGHWMLAIDVEHFLPLEDFKSRIQGLVEMAHTTAPAAGFEEVLVPGEPEQRTQDTRARDGIPLPDATVSDLTELGRRYSTPFPKART